MSYTACIYGEKHSQVDGTSYACVVVMALMEASRTAIDPKRRLMWDAKLAKFLDRMQTCGTDIIGSTFDRIVVTSVDDKDEFIKALFHAMAKLKSFKGEIPNAYLRELTGQGDGPGYIQNIVYEPGPFVKTIRTIINLLRGIESY